MEYTFHDGTKIDLNDDDIAMIYNDKCNNIIKVWFVEDLANHQSRSEEEHNFIIENTKPICDEYVKFYWCEGPIPYDMYRSENMEEKIMKALKEAEFNPVVDEFGYINFEKGRIAIINRAYGEFTNGTIYVYFDDIRSSYLEYTKQNCIMFLMKTRCVSAIIN